MFPYPSRHDHPHTTRPAARPRGELRQNEWKVQKSITVTPGWLA
ncbi:hypothetical protein [Lysobacter gummosus]